MKNKRFILLFTFLCLLFTGCSHKKNTTVQKKTYFAVNTVFKQLVYRKTFNSNLQKYGNLYLSDFVFRLLTTRLPVENSLDFYSTIYAFEKYNKNFTSLYDSLGYYDSVTTDAKKLDAAVNEDELSRLEKFLEEMLASSDGIFSLLEKDFIDNAVEVSKLNRDLKLKIFEYGKEYFIPQQSGDNLVFINADKDLIYRNVYDKEFRLIKVEKWTNSEKENLRTSFESYEYMNDSVIPSAKTLSSGNSEEKFYYNEDGLITRYEEFKYIGKAKIKTPVKFQYWQYDSEKRITVESETEFSNSSSTSKESRYNYKKEGQTPDYEYYENSVLKIKTVYQSSSDYETYIYFDEEMSVHTIYKNYKKIKDVYYIGDMVLRENEYE